jgi:hypothetical protein
VVEGYGVQLVVVMPGAWEASSERVRFFDRVANGDLPAWLTPITGDGKLRLFRVDPGNREADDLVSRRITRYTS